MPSTKELIALWSNDTKRRAFLETYKEWGVWFEQPQTNCTYYKFDLPDGTKIIVMEYLGYNHGYKCLNESEYILHKQFYLQDKEYFQPTVVSDSFISNYLKDLKAKIIKGEF